MKWEETTASTCRWAEYASVLFEDGGVDVLWEDSRADYQGHADIFAKLDYDWRETRYMIGGWTYGSCSGCDGWEGEPREKILAEMAKSFQTMNREALGKYLAGLITENPTWVKDAAEDDWEGSDAVKLAGKIRAIEAELAKPQRDF
jgi:hypothetical protein